MADTSVTDLPLVGDPEDLAANGANLSRYINQLRTEALSMRGQFTGDLETCISLYLYGTENPGQQHVIPKVQGMINSFVERASKTVPGVTVKPVTVKDSGPVVTTTAGEAVNMDANTIAEWLQNIFDVVQQRSRSELFYRDMAFYGKLMGWQDALVDWDPIAKKCVYRVIPLLQWYKDPLCPELSDMAYVGLDWPVDAEWAKRMWPQASAAIDDAATRAIQQAPASGGYSDVFYGQQYARPIVTMSIWWLRNREQAMTPQEAMESGQVMRTPDATYARDGEAVTEDHPNWPRKYVTSQTIQIRSEIVSDEVLDAWDIPVVTNFNVRIPNRPFGQSDAIRVRTIQKDRNTVHASSVKHVQWFQGPTLIMPMSLTDAMPDDFRNQGMKPNKTYKLDDETYRQCKMMGNGKLFEAYDPPPLPPALIHMGQELDAAFEVAGGRPAVSQGNAPTSNSSGALANTLLEAANSTSDFTFLYLEEMWYRTSRLALHYCLTRLSASDLAKIDRTYDLPTTQLLLATAQEMEWEIEIMPTSSKQQHEQQTLLYLEAGLLDLEGARDALGLDHKTIQMRQQAAMEAQAQAQMAQGAVPGAENGEQQQLQGQGPGSQPAPPGAALTGPAAAA
jgi:hypothetical protein